MALLRRAKREELRREGVPVLSDSLVDSRISKAQLAQYCRRRTRGEEATIRMVERLLQELMGDRGRDLLGVPLLEPGEDGAHLAGSEEARQVHPGPARCVSLHRDRHHHHQGGRPPDQVQVCPRFNVPGVLSLPSEPVYSR